MPTTRKPTAPPAELVTGGKPNLGTFELPPRNVNLMDEDVFGMGAATPRLLKELRYKQWQFFLVVHRRFVMGIAVIDMGKVATGSFMYVYDREKKQYYDYRKQIPFADIALAENVWDGACHFRHKGYSIEFRNRLDAGEHDVTVEMAASGKKPAVSADLKVFENLDIVKPLVVSLPVGPRSSMYSHKMAAPVQGTIRVGEEEATLDASMDFVTLDEHKAFYPRHIHWKWMTFGCRMSDGSLIGANLTDNTIEDQRKWNENAIWTPGAITLLGPAKFEFDRNDIMKPWHIREEDGRVDLDFTPLGVKLEQMNLLLIKMDYRQPFGLFNGTVTDGSGNTHKVKDGFGVTEYYDALV